MSPQYITLPLYCTFFRITAEKRHCRKVLDGLPPICRATFHKPHIPSRIDEGAAVVLYVVTSGLPVTRTRRVRNIGRIDMALHGLVNEPASGRVVSEMLSAARPSAPQRWWKSSLGTSDCTSAHAGVRSFHGSQMRELRVRLGACRGALLRDGARATAESPWRFHRFLHPVRACVSPLSRPRANRKWFRRSTRPSRPKTPERKPAL